MKTFHSFHAVVCGILPGDNEPIRPVGKPWQFYNIFIAYIISWLIFEKSILLYFF